MLDPDIQRLLDTVFNVAPVTFPPPVDALRATALQAPLLFGGAPEAVASIMDSHIDDGVTAIPLRIYRPETRQPLPLVLYAHGGGWVTGSLDSHDKFCRIVANRLPAVLVSVDYRCAPEHIYPAALDDVAAAWRWARGHAGELGADATRFAVAGDSSGGNLAAALVLRLRDEGAVQPQLQILLYPALDATCSRAAYREFATGFNLSAQMMAWYWDVYRAGAPPDASGLSPLAANDLSGLAPAVIVVAENDVLRDDGVDYAARLHAAGVPTRLIRCDGMIHGFVRWTGVVTASQRWIDAALQASREELV
ncbi:MAG: alpha/beta hydrolase [Casimicrobiaceae bacterium]